MHKTLRIPALSGGEKIFFIAYGVFLIFSILNTSFYARYFASSQIVWIFGFLFLLLMKELLLEKYSIRSLLVLALSFCVAVIMYIAGSAGFMCIIVFVYCGRKIRFERIASFSVIISSITISFVIVSSLLGIIENYVGVHDGNNRYYLGFLYGLYAPCYLFNITALVLYIKKTSIKWRHLLLLLAVNYVFYMVSDARLSFWGSLALIVAYAIFKISPNILEKKKILCFFMSMSWIIIALASIYLIVTYNAGKQWMRELDILLGGRLSLGQRGLITYGISWFGQEVHWHGSGLNIFGKRIAGAYMYVDNLYTKIAIQYGVVFLFIYIVFFTLVAFSSWKKREYALLVILTVLAARGIVDDLTLSLQYNTFWFLVGTKLFNTLKDYQNLSKEKIHRLQASK